jgi:hypothetical protein
MSCRWPVTLIVLLGLAAAGRPDEAADALLKEVAAAPKDGPAARAAWEKLVARGPAVLPDILRAMDTPDTVAANWLRTAFDRILDRADGRGIDVEALLAVVNDPKRQGRVRRLALDVVEKQRPGTRERLTAGWLDDPEFRYEAVAGVMQEAETRMKDGQKDRARDAYRKAFAATRDVGQAQTLKTRLQELGDSVSVAGHMGFLTDWYLIGPFDGMEKQGFQTAYPPEKQIDLNAELPGKAGPVKWQRYQVKEAASGLAARVALVNIPEALGTADDAVAYGYTAFTMPKGGEVEFPRLGGRQLHGLGQRQARLRLRGVPQRRPPRPAPLQGFAATGREPGPGEGLPGPRR